MINFNNLSYSYLFKTPFQEQALFDINLDIKEGEFLFIVGKTGSGKSTLVQHLNGLIIPTSGSVVIDGFVNSSVKKERDKNLTELRQKVGVVFQFSEYQLFEETVLKDVSYGPMNYGDKEDVAKDKAKKALSSVGLDESFYEKSPFELSGGEKRRVAIAGILAPNPKIIVLDEPTAGLDNDGTKEIMSLLKKLNEEGKTIIVVSHDMDVVSTYAKRVVVLDKGKIIKDTNPCDLFKEDVEKYSLKTPDFYKLVHKLEKQFPNINFEDAHDFDSLIKVIKEVK